MQSELKEIGLVCSAGVTRIHVFRVQIVGMSATLPNLDVLARWLRADLYHTDYRPVPLAETVKISSTVYDSDMSRIRDLDLSMAIKVVTLFCHCHSWHPSKEKEGICCCLEKNLTTCHPFTHVVLFQGDEDHIIQLCLETIQEGCSVLIFCPTKNWCETLATNIARQFYTLYKLNLPQDGSGSDPSSPLCAIFLRLLRNNR